MSTPPPSVLPCDPIQLRLDVDRLWPAAARARGVDPSRHFGCVFGGFTGASVDMNGELWTSAPGGFRIVGRPFDVALEELARALEDIGYHVERTRNRWRVLGWAAVDVAVSTIAGRMRDTVRVAWLPPSHPAREEHDTRILADRQRRDADTAPASNPKIDHARGLR
jgi:hypothetical protein